MALSIDSSTGVTLASWGNSTSPKFWGLEVLSPRDSLRSSTHEGSRTVTHTTLRNAASVELQGKKCCLYKMPYVAAPIGVPRWHHHKFYALRATSYRRTYKSQNSFFGSRVMRFVRDPSCHIETPTWIFMRRSTSKGGTRNGLLIAFLEESRKEYLKRLCKQTPLWLVVMSRSLRNPEEQDDRKKRDVEQSAPNHVCHTHCIPIQLGTTANRSTMFLRTDFEKRAIWQGSIEEPAAKDFVARKVRTIEWNEVLGTSWNAIRCKERLRSHPAAVIRQATINLIHEVGNPLGNPVPGCTALT